jgi:hypothetical protein
MALPRLASLSVFVSAASLVAGGYAVVVARRVAAAPPAGRDGACTCADAPTRRELDELRRGLAAALGARGGGAREVPQDFAEQLAALRTDVDRLRGREGDAAPDGGGSASPLERPRRLVELVAPSAAVSVRQLPDGSIAATNTDPSLTGRVMTVDARAEDGTVQKMLITVPAPGQ